MTTATTPASVGVKMPADDATEDDERDQEGGARIEEDAAELGEAAVGQRVVDADAEAAGLEVGGQHQCGADEDTGDRAAEEEAPGRDVGEVAVDDHQRRGRDDRADHRRRRRDAGGVGARVALGDHPGDQQRAECRALRHPPNR